MTAGSVNNRRAYDALLRVRDLVEQYGTAEHRERLRRIMGGAVPAPNRAPVELEAFQSEALVILFEMVGGLIEASKPQPRGRPRKKSAKDDKAA